MSFSRSALASATLFACALAGSAVATASADQPYSFDKTFGRLPKTVVPTAYDIVLKPDIVNRRTFGHEVVRVRVRHATNTIVFNTLELTVTGATLGATHGTPTITADANTFSAADGLPALTPGVNFNILNSSTPPTCAAPNACRFRPIRVGRSAFPR